MSKPRDVEKRLERTEQQLLLLQKISRLMVRDISLETSLSRIVSMVVEFMECDSCLLYLLENDELVLRASNTAQPSVMNKVRLSLTEGLTGWVARERRLLSISRQAYHDSRFKYFSDLPEDSYEAFLSAPILSRRGIEGVINVQHRTAHQHSGFEMELLTTVGEQVGCMLLLDSSHAGDVALAAGSSRSSAD